MFFIFSGSEVQLNWYVLLLPALLLIMAGIGLGLGIIVSSLTTKYRDLQQLLGFGIQLAMYASPVIYPLSTVPAQWRWLLLSNPVTPVIEMFRRAFLGVSSLSPVYLLYSAAFMFVALLIGILIFNRADNTFMDTV
jgi:lipopolysaccharide transport system permease protein